MIEDCCYRTLAEMTVTLHKGHGHHPYARKRAIGLVVDGIHQCKAIHSGLVSKKAQGMLSSKMTKEHYHSRKKRAIALFEMIDSGATIDELTDFIIESCHVHRVTKKENMALVPFQKNTEKYPTWQEQYAAAGIELVPYVKKSAKKNVYIIHGIEYNSLSEGAKANNCKDTDVYYRCITSKSKKYCDWKVRKLDNEIQ